MNKLKTIYHIADVHIRNVKRHKEYREVFTKMFEEIRKRGTEDAIIYLADNWKVIGKTAGLPKHKASSMKWNTGEELKELFVKPTGENQKIILFKDLRSKREIHRSLTTNQNPNVKIT